MLESKSSVNSDDILINMIIFCTLCISVNGTDSSELHEGLESSPRTIIVHRTQTLGFQAAENTQKSMDSRHHWKAPVPRVVSSRS